MNKEVDGPREDIVFLKSLVGAGAGAKRDALMLLAVGLIFGSLNFVYWLIFAGIVDWPAPAKNWLCIAAIAVFAATRRHTTQPVRHRRRWMLCHSVLLWSDDELSRGVACILARTFYARRRARRADVV